MLAALSFQFTPLVLALLAGWIMCVCVHEFAHALVAYWGGDRSVRRKGYLSLDPTRFIDPVFSLLLPAVILWMGGLPLPGGSVRIDSSSLKHAGWMRRVSAAGPVSNALLFLLFCLPLHPLLGLADPAAAEQPTWVMFFGAMAYLNFIATLFNLIPVPPLDGYGMIEHRFSYETQWKMRQPQVVMISIGTLFLVFATVDAVWIPFEIMLGLVTETLGVPIDLLHDGFLFVLRAE